MPDPQILPGILQLLAQFPGIIIIPSLIHIIEGTVNRKIDFQLTKTIRTALYMIQEFFQFPV
jgi:hypothetical protein